MLDDFIVFHWFSWLVVWQNLSTISECKKKLEVHKMESIYLGCKLPHKNIVGMKEIEIFFILEEILKRFASPSEMFHTKLNSEFSIPNYAKSEPGI